MKNTPPRRTPCSAVLEHIAVIDNLLPLIQAKINQERLDANEGRSIWADAGSIAHTRELVERIAEFYGIQEEKE